QIARDLLLAGLFLAAPGCNADAVDPDAEVRIEIAAGDDQAGIPGVSLPDSLVVRVTDGGGQPIAGRAVAWEIVGGGGSVELTSISDASGRAMALWTLGAVVPQSLTASVGRERVTFAATAESGEAGTAYAG